MFTDRHSDCALVSIPRSESRGREILGAPIEDQREPSGTEREFWARMVVAERCPIYARGPNGLAGYHVCAIGARVKAGATFRDAVLDGLAALQWTDPEGPFTRQEAARRLTERACRHHRDAADEVLKSLGPEWTPHLGVPVRQPERPDEAP
jgi:hypothetical protein